MDVRRTCHTVINRGSLFAFLTADQVLSCVGVLVLQGGFRVLHTRVVLILFFVILNAVLILVLGFLDGRVLLAEYLDRLSLLTETL